MKEEHTITENKLKRIFDAAAGKRSHYIFFNDEPEDFVQLLKDEDWIVYVKNSGKRPMYRITVKLYEKFAELSDDDKKQLAWAQKMEDMDEEDRAIEEARVAAVEINKPTMI